MKAAVDPDYCAGHGACVITCPEVFELGPEGYSHVLVDEVPVELEAKVRQAAHECPAEAITVEG